MCTNFFACCHWQEVTTKLLYLPILCFCVETARRQRQSRKRRQRWVWGSIATAITLGTAALAWSYLPSGKSSSPSVSQSRAPETDHSSSKWSRFRQIRSTLGRKWNKTEPERSIFSYDIVNNNRKMMLTHFFLKGMLTLLVSCIRVCMQNSRVYSSCKIIPKYIKMQPPNVVEIFGQFWILRSIVSWKNFCC